MKIALIGNVNSIHTRRWVDGMSGRGNEVHLISADVPKATYSQYSTQVLPFRPKAGYYLNAPFLRRLLNRLKPDVVHAHYASGYGTLMRLSGYRPYILSVWGADVFEYADQSPWALRRIQKNIRSAASVCSTSNMMCAGRKNCARIWTRFTSRPLESIRMFLHRRKSTQITRMNCWLQLGR